MPTYPESGVKLIADTAEYTKAMDDAIKLADRFDSLGTISINVSADVDTSALDSAVLPDDGETIAVNIDATMTGDDLPLDGETVNFTVDATVNGQEVEDLPTDGTTIDFTAKGTLEGDVTKLPSDGSKINTSLDIQESPTAKATLDSVNTLKNLATLETVWNITGTAVDLLGKFSEFAIAPLLSIDEAVARVNAQTASAIPNVDGLIKTLYSADLGGIDQISDVVIQAKQLGAPIEEAATAALTFTKVFADQNPAQVMNTLNQMVTTGLAPNFATASDMLTVAFQNGANRAGDLLQTLNGNATALKDMGYDGQTALGLITQGLDGGYKSANDVATSLTKVKQNLTAAAGNDSADASKALESLGIPNPAETGEAWTKDFLASVIAGIQSAPVSDTQKQAMLSAILGGKIGAKEFSSFMQLSPSTAAEMFAPMKGAAETAATEIDNSLSGAIADFTLAAQTAAMDFLSSEQIDLPGKIDALKSGLQDGLNALAEGGTLSDALTIALKPIGFDDEFRGLESMLGNFVIAILQAVAFLQSLDPANWEAKKGTDALIAQQGATQLAFDLKVGNPDEVAGELALAVSRGVKPEQISGAIGTAVNDLIAAGTPELAQSLVDAVSTAQTDANANVQLTASGSLMNVEPTVTPEALDALQAKIDASKPVTVTITPTAETALFDSMMGGLTVTTETAAQPVADMNTQIATTGTNATTATTAVTTLNEQTQTQGNNAGQAAPKVQQTADAAKKLGDNASAATPLVGDVSGAMDAIAASAPLAASGLYAADAALAQIIATANGLAAANDAVAQKQGQLDSQLNNSGGSSGGSTPVTTSGGGNSGGNQPIVAALQNYIPGGSFTQKGGSAVTINNTNLVQSQAQADAVGYSTAKQLRGV